MRLAATVLVIASLVVTVSAQSSPRGPASVVPNGVWGGEHIRMEVTENGADIEFDCARGSISQRLELDPQGRFKVSGTYKAETPAPAAADGGSTGSEVTATYIGVLSGSSLRLEVSVEGQGAPRTFVLVQGDQGQLAKCA